MTATASMRANCDSLQKVNLSYLKKARECTQVAKNILKNPYNSFSIKYIFRINLI